MTDLQKEILNVLESEIVELTHQKYGFNVQQEDYEEVGRDFVRWLTNLYLKR